LRAGAVGPVLWGFVGAARVCPEAGKRAGAGPVRAFRAGLGGWSRDSEGKVGLEGEENVGQA